MANESAWEAGWKMGQKGKSGSGKQDSSDDEQDKPKRGKRQGKGSGSGGSSGVYSGFSGMGILPILSKIMGSKKKGGPIKKTGVYLLHKNEYVVPAKHRSAPKRMRKRTVIKH